MLQDFIVHIEKNFPELLKHKFLIACSGGLDSVVLAHLCQKQQMDFVLAHCNFQLRGEESDLDAEFVEKLSLKWDKKLYVTRFNTKAYVAEHKVSVQMAARELRYQWFNEIIAADGLKAILTAHHADDNLETFLINLSRGSGIEGLTGIPQKTETVYRPLLKYSRAELLKYAEKNALEWREDASNANTKYLRNNIRHQIIPKLKELHPSFLSNFKHSIAYLDQTNALAKQEIRTWKNKQFIADGNQFKISISSLKQCNPLKAYLYGLFKDYGFREWNNLKDLLEGMSGKSVVSKTHRLLKDREYLLLSEINEITGNSLSYTIEKTHKVLVKPLSIVFSKVTQRAENSEHIIYVDENALKYPLVIRKWNKGDYFYPIGLHGKKKLAKFFKDEKVSLLDKEAQFKVVDTTTEIMKIAIRV